MRKQARYGRKTHIGVSAWGMLLGVLTLITACGGGDGSVGVGSGQDPDPVAVDFAIAYVKGPVPMDQPDVREPITFNVGTDLYVRDRAAPAATERNVTTAETLGLGDVRDVEISVDGTKLLFAMRGPVDENLALDDPDQPTWNIWEYDLTTDALRRIIASDIQAEDGHDIAPHYLPDGRIVFSSTRQRQSKAILLDEGKPQFSALDENRNEFAFVLHVMEEDGTDVRQISFNQSHDLDPTVLDSGRILFSRWDRMGGVNGINLYTANPDGTDLQLLYGAESHATGTNGEQVQFLQPREMEDGRVMAIVQPFTGTDFGGAIVAIDTPNYVENTQPTVDNIGVLSGPAQEAATVNDVRTDTLPSPGGRFSAAYPLWDGTQRILVSWTQCRLQEDQVIVPCDGQNNLDPLAVPAAPLYGIWMYDTRDDTQLPIVAPEEGIYISDVVAAQPRTNPPVILDQTPIVDFDPLLATEGVGILNIRSVYDISGVAQANIAALADPAQTTADQRPARFLRLVKAVSIPDDDLVDLDNTAFGRSAAQGMREILAYAPIEPDGSVRMKVPANVPFAISVLDADGRRITPRHRNWLQVRPGEELTCNGCHDPTSGMSHGRAESFASAYAGFDGATGDPFPNTDAALFAEFGETMAETRTRISCGTDNCAALNPRLEISYTDVWTDEVAAGRAADAPFAYRYADLTTAIPASLQCLDSGWTSRCRSTIHYEAHIHPLWSKARVTLDVDGVTVLQDNTCTTCHTPVDANNAPQVPASQLDLTDGLAPEQMDHFKAYRELLFNDDEQEVVNGALVDRLIQVGTDPDTGDPIFSTVNVDASMSVGGANASDRFMDRFDAGGTHAGYLDAAELRLISEWLDIGAQYYNDPFAVPVN